MLGCKGDRQAPCCSGPPSHHLRRSAAQPPQPRSCCHDTAQVGTSHSRHTAALRPWPQLTPRPHLSPAWSTAPSEQAGAAGHRTAARGSLVTSNAEWSTRSLCTARSKLLLLLLTPRKWHFELNWRPAAPRDAARPPPSWVLLLGEGGEGEADSRKGCCSSCTRLPAPDTHTHTRDGTPTGPGRQEVQHATGQPISSHCTHASLLCFITVFSS